MAWVQEMNRGYAAQHPGDSTLEARLRSYELAANMQLSVPEAVDLEGEPEAARRLYGLDQKETGPLARRCMLARRLLERGVRFVQVYHGASGKDWDAHGDLSGNHSGMAAEYDQPVAALLQDLHSRGLLEDTLVMGVTEFGRTPVAQGAGKKGRDHHPTCFTCWMAGAGLRHGFAYGQSDDLGYKPAENPVTIYDFHATALHLLGLNHEKLTYYHNGIRRRLTDVHGRIVDSILG
jgi:arylsulfatase A-like enzyme